jgi:hypothetical protein
MARARTTNTEANVVISKTGIKISDAQRDLES